MTGWRPVTADYPPVASPIGAFARVLIGGIYPVTGMVPVTLSAYLRRLPTPFGVDRRDRRFLGRETRLPAFPCVPPVPTVVPPPLPLLVPHVGSWPSAAAKRTFGALSARTVHREARAAYGLSGITQLHAASPTCCALGI